MKVKYYSPVITVEELTKKDVLLASTSNPPQQDFNSSKDNLGVALNTWGNLEKFV